MKGFINILKPPGMTSHDVVSYLRKKLGERCIGHLGTLDPFAAGVLPVAVSSAATRLIEYLPADMKKYRAELLLGVTSNTGDYAGELSYNPSPVIPDKRRVLEVLNFFRGKISQTPPMASSIKVNGRRLYEYFRKNMEVSIPEREVTIFSIDLIDYSYPKMLIDVECSGGTYIRTLCSDIGKSLNCGALMRFLVRSRSGFFFIDDAIPLADIEEKIITKQDFLLSPAEVLNHLPLIEIPSELADRIGNGNRIALKYDKSYAIEKPDTLVRVCLKSGEMIAIAVAFIKKDVIIIIPKKVLT